MDDLAASLAGHQCRVERMSKATIVNHAASAVGRQRTFNLFGRNARDSRVTRGPRIAKGYRSVKDTTKILAIKDKIAVTFELKSFLRLGVLE